jgi:hypothetical protein
VNKRSKSQIRSRKKSDDMVRLVQILREMREDVLATQIQNMENQYDFELHVNKRIFSLANSRNHLGALVSSEARCPHGDGTLHSTLKPYRGSFRYCSVCDGNPRHLFCTNLEFVDMERHEEK